MNESLRQAEVASREVATPTQEAIYHLQGTQPHQNAYGILSNPNERLADLRAAQDEIAIAIVILQTTSWPKEADYATV